MYRPISFLGLLVMLGIAWLLSENRRKFPVRVVIWGLGLQFLLALLVFTPRFGDRAFGIFEAGFGRLIESSDAGAKFLFGGLTTDFRYGAVMAFHVLPIIIFVSALSAILYHLGIIQAVVRAMARLMQWTMKISGAEALAAALMVFFGIEATTAIAEYVRKMTRSELFAVMCAFMATIAGSVMAAYVGFGAKAVHLLTASLMSAPAAVVVAKIMIPETGQPATAGRVEFNPPRTTANVIDAAASGASQGVKLAINIGAMLIAFVGLVFLVNLALEAIFGITLEGIMGWLFLPLALVMGVSPDDAFHISQLLGVKTILNEFLAYQGLSGMIAWKGLDPRSITIATYALCGFANPGSTAILIGGLAGIDPERRGTFARLGWKALAAGTLAAFSTACFAGMLA